ncbi:MAG: aminoglycoside 6-adenylyltransferase [Anaerolineae bacterium]|nr:aminoglycoside 6-adenylyltransferase [Anaerolineae bacterium]
MMELHELHLPTNHREVVSRFLAACQADDRIVAAFLGGSYATNHADIYSDLDLYFVTTDSSYQEFPTEKEYFVRQLGVPLFLTDFGNLHGSFFILSNGAEGEIWFGRESDFTNIHSGAYIVLLDKNNILAGQVFSTPTAELSEQRELLRRQIDGFWHELSHFIKAMGRQQLWFAYGQIEVMRRMCVLLARLKYNFSDPYLDENEPYFKIEHALPIETLSPLQSTFCPMEYAAMLQTAKVICRFYQDIAPALAKVHELSYQPDLERMLIKQLRDLPQFPSSLNH